MQDLSPPARPSHRYAVRRNRRGVGPLARKSVFTARDNEKRGRQKTAPLFVTSG
jgi:hypothetical protein